MKNVALVGVTALSLAASYWVGSGVTHRREALEDNLCLTDKAIASVIASSLASVTKEDVRRYGVARFRRYHQQSVRNIHNFEEIAPCTFQVAVPPFPPK